LQRIAPLAFAAPTKLKGPWFVAVIVSCSLLLGNRYPVSSMAAFLCGISDRSCLVLGDEADENYDLVRGSADHLPTAPGAAPGPQPVIETITCGTGVHQRSCRVWPTTHQVRARMTWLFGAGVDPTTSNHLLIRRRYGCYDIQGTRRARNGGIMSLTPP
jgi:hypothetical protein